MVKRFYLFKNDDNFKLSFPLLFLICTHFLNFFFLKIDTLFYSNHYLVVQEIILGTSLGFLYVLDSKGEAKPGFPVDMGPIHVSELYLCFEQR